MGAMTDAQMERVKKAIAELNEAVNTLEPPPKRWRDVTAECRTDEDGYCVFSDTYQSGPVNIAILSITSERRHEGYRLRKVSYAEDFRKRYAFIIEKEEA